MQPVPSNWNVAKQMILSILVGTAISLLTILFQYGVEWLRNIPAEAPGALVGMAHYISKWRSFLLA
jgi:hypothetical protein